MNIQGLKLMQQLYPTNSTHNSPSVSESTSNLLHTEKTTTFSDILSQSLSSLEEKQLASDYSIQGLVTGEIDNLHDVMIQTTEAQIALELAVQLRNRSLEAMNELKNMQF